MSAPHEIFQRTIVTKSPSVTFDDVKRMVADKMARNGIEDEISAIVHRENGWQITFGKKSTADRFIRKGPIWLHYKCYAYSPSRFKYVTLTLADVPAYIPDECITKELLRLNCENVGKMKRITIDNIENGERKVAVYIDSTENTLPERVVLEYQGKLEPIRISGYEPMLME